MGRQQPGASRSEPWALAVAAALALASIGPAHAEGLKPLQGQVIDLGYVSDVAYYTLERDGFRVVATLAKKGEDGVPLRVVAVLAPDQSLVLSTPREAGTPPDAVEIIGRADTVLVHRRPRRSRTERGPPMTGTTYAADRTAEVLALMPETIRLTRDRLKALHMQGGLRRRELLRPALPRLCRKIRS